MSCERTNCAHDDAGAWAAMAAIVREETARFGALHSWPPEELALPPASPWVGGEGRNGERLQRSASRDAGLAGVSVTGRCGP